MEYTMTEILLIVAFAVAVYRILPFALGIAVITILGAIAAALYPFKMIDDYLTKRKTK